MKYQILLYYKYVEIPDPLELRRTLLTLCTRLSLKGRIIVAHEGINGTLEGTVSDTEKFIEEITRDEKFKDINWKKSVGTGNAFPKLSVKVRPEIVTTGVADKDFGPLKHVTGKYITAEELNEWYKSNKEFYIVDMRNDYEFEVGRFKNSILPSGLGHFRDVPNVIRTIEHLKDKTVVTVCTGGVRCETASGLLLKHGFKDVYQLQHGIVTFMEKFPNTYFEGKLCVFDGRRTMAFNEDSPDYKVVGVCNACHAPSENLVDWYTESGIRKYGILCETCCESGKIRLQH